ncbi:MAG: signal recognition particle protein [Planctomycetaceae bacterium]|mgnify:CR=1 FL=1|jgi:signal recognition particle subunit SRP54|nr:signal recognition particle protein [Planctomycetaceae bacterium]MBT6486783.1 signal recognition particle protein [Planctomycetaceae bacterium]MBT6493372.1 signal recognition particle protein [Planctomycetaceae bacterium]
MFEGITKSLSDALGAIGRGKLTEGNIREGMKQVRQALLEADVNYEIANDFVNRVTEQAVGEQVLKSLKPSEQIVGIVHDELIQLMGPVDHSLGLKRQGITVLMMCGLQGSGKTTTCGKLATMLQQQGRHPMLVAADLQRPAAIEQLKVIGEQVGVPVYSEPPSESTPVKVCRNALKEAEKQGDVNVVILDTAGRLHVDDELMAELELIDRKLQPDQALLVCDAMTGQDAVNSAKAFNDALEIDGVILTKLDGDTRGGAALSVKAVTGVPIKFVGVGEQLDKLDEFHPDRMAGRILGMGDVLSLVESVRDKLDEDEMLAQQQKMQEGKFTLDDFRKQMAQIKKLGSMGEIMKMIPGMGGMAEQMGDMNPDQDLVHIEAIISSMTLDERENPEKIDRSRRNRIAQGSGSDPSDVNRLLKDFDNMSGVMQKMAGMGMRDRMKAINELKDMGAMDPNASMNKKKERSKRGPVDRNTIREKRKKERKNARNARKKNKRKR